MESFGLLFVCTANRIRSPLAAALVNAIDPSGVLRAESAGVLARPGAPPVPEAVEVGRRMGVDLAEYRSRDLSDLDLSEWGLILGFEFQHVAHVVVDHGAPAERTFLLPEAVRLLEGVGGREGGITDRADAMSLIAEADLARSRGSFLATDEVADPIGGPISAYERTTIVIREMCTRLVGVLAPRRT